MSCSFGCCGAKGASHLASHGERKAFVPGAKDFPEGKVAVRKGDGGIGIGGGAFSKSGPGIQNGEPVLFKLALQRPEPEHGIAGVENFLAVRQAFEPVLDAVS